MIISALCHNGELIIDPQDEAKLERLYKSMEGKTLWISYFETRPPRSLLANNYYWKLLELIGNEVGETSEELHAMFKDELLPRVYTKENGEERPLPKSTTRLTSKEFSQYVDRVKMMAAEHYNVVLPDSNEITL